MDFDAIVVGAGPAGCIAARDLARSGLRVGLFDAGTKEKMGKSIIVEVERSIFTRAGVRPPVADEIPYHPERIRFYSPRGREVFIVNEAPCVALFLDRFARQMLEEAEAAGARFFGGYRARKAVVHGNRVSGALFFHRRRKEEVRARLVIDATGFEAALVRGLDPDPGIAFRDDLRDVVVAANFIHRIDPDGAARAMRSGLHGDEEIRARVGTFGSYSTEFSHLSISRQQAYILIGHKADFDGPPISRLIDDFKDRHGYFGKRLRGGKGHIRISRTLDRLVCDGFMVVGEAACMVIPINGSGVASALLAGRLAAQVASEALLNGRPSTEALWPYAVRYHRGRGAVLATFAAVRRMTEALSPDQVADMMESGLSGPEDVLRASSPRPFSLSPLSLLRRTLSLVRRPDLIKPVLRTGSAVFAIQRHYQRYPERYGRAEFSAWTEKSRRIFAALGA